MGGCCCSSRKYQLHGTPVYYYCPQALEERESLTSHDSALLIDLNLDTSIPDTYRSPPTPIPFDVVLGIPQSTNTESVAQAFSGSAYEKAACLNLKELDCKAEGNTALPASPKKFEVGFHKSDGLHVSVTEEEDVCPTCFEEYDADNPRITTKCNHQFHLSCILEWMERSDTCPICSQIFLEVDNDVAHEIQQLLGPYHKDSVQFGKRGNGFRSSLMIPQKPKVPNTGILFDIEMLPPMDHPGCIWSLYASDSTFIYGITYPSLVFF